MTEAKTISDMRTQLDELEVSDHPEALHQLAAFARLLLGRLSADRACIVELRSAWSMYATEPSELDRIWRLFNVNPELYPDPRGGSDNDNAIERAVMGAEHVVAAWGYHAERIAPGRAGEIENMIYGLRRSNGSRVEDATHVPAPHCLGFTKDDSPRHPLRVAYATPLEPTPTICSA